MAEPTYEELKTLRAQEWREAQDIATKRHDALVEKLGAMPDVTPPESPYSHPGIVCACGGSEFAVRRWVSLNGRKYRAELGCVACGLIGTWDWLTDRWL